MIWYKFICCQKFNTRHKLSYPYGIIRKGYKNCYIKQNANENNCVLKEWVIFICRRLNPSHRYNIETSPNLKYQI